MILSASALDQLDLTSVCSTRFETPEERDEFLSPAGCEHYRLLAYLATQFRDRHFIDIGTNHGLAAMALAFHPTNRVISFDSSDRPGEEWRKRKFIPPQMEFHRVNLFDDRFRDMYRELLLTSTIIFFDQHPHHGLQEMNMLKWLLDNNYKGLFVLDDTFYFKTMRDNLLYMLPFRKGVYDVTAVGHWSGSAIIDLSGMWTSLEIIERVPPRLPTLRTDKEKVKGWTAVTAAFGAIDYNLVNMSMAVDVPLVVFCDAENRTLIQDLRPPCLRDQTHYIVSDTLPTVGSMLKTAITDNLFAASHFAWVDVTLEKTGYKSAVFFSNVWSEFRDTFSIGISAPDTLQTSFFTGRGENVLEVIQFSENLSETLHAHPEWFELYLCLETSLITNYVWMREHTSEVVKNILLPLSTTEDRDFILEQLSRKWLEAVGVEAVTATPSEVATVRDILISIAKHNMEESDEMIQLILSVECDEDDNVYTEVQLIVL